MSDAPLPTNRDIGLEVSSGTTYPGTFSTPLDLVNPDAVLSGTNRGIQNLGSPSLYADGGNNRIVAAPNNNPSVLMGNQPTFGQGFYVGKPGVNVITNTDPSQFIFNSNQNTFKITQSGTYTFNTNAVTSATDSQGATIPHGLGYVPIIIAYTGTASNFYFPLPYTLTTGSSLGAGLDSYKAQLQLVIDVDTTNIYIGQIRDLFYMSATGLANGKNYAAQSWPIKYYILQETAN